MAKSKLAKLYSLVTGLNIDIDAVYKRLKTQEEKDKFAHSIIWTIKRGAAFDSLKNAKEEDLNEAQKAYIELVDSLEDPNDDDEVLTPEDKDNVEDELDTNAKTPDEDDPAVVTPETAEDIANIENPEEAKVMVSNNEALAAMTTSTTYKSIMVENGDLNSSIKLNASDSVFVNGLTVNGDKGATNGKINFTTPELTLKNVTISDENNSIYNVFEGSQTPSKPESFTTKLEASNITVSAPTLKHNVINVYTPADNAEITIKNSNFTLDVNNTNILRLANTPNSKNITVTFENVNWNYINDDSADWKWAGLVIYQPYSSDKAVGNTDDALDAIKTWKFNFINCKYNGIKVTANNFGEHNQVVLLYNIGNTGEVTDAAEVFTLSFK